jgi:hypothetical protein
VVARRTGRQGGQRGSPSGFDRDFLEALRNSIADEFTEAHNNVTVAGRGRLVTRLHPQGRWRRALGRPLALITGLLVLFVGAAAIASVFLSKPKDPGSRGKQPAAQPSQSTAARAKPSAARPSPAPTSPAAVPTPTSTPTTRPDPKRSSAPATVPASPSPSDHRTPPARIANQDFDVTASAQILPGQRLVLSFRATTATTASSADAGSFPCRPAGDQFRCTVVAAELVPGVRYELTTEVVGTPVLGEPFTSLEGVLAPFEPILVIRPES